VFLLILTWNLSTCFHFQIIELRSIEDASCNIECEPIKWIKGRILHLRDKCRRINLENKYTCTTLSARVTGECIFNLIGYYMTKKRFSYKKYAQAWHTIDG
jgi:hypothetical protein